VGMQTWPLPAAVTVPSSRTLPEDDDMIYFIFKETVTRNVVVFVVVNNNNDPRATVL